MHRRCRSNALYRWWLAEGDGELLWVMLNPSTAGLLQDDPTTRKVRGFTARAGYRGWAIVNLYALRATKPDDLWRALAEGADPAGMPTTPIVEQITRAAADAAAVVVAWGAHAARSKDSRDHAGRVVSALLATDKPVLAIGGRPLTCGQPQHPLMAAYALGLAPAAWLNPVATMPPSEVSR